LARFEKRAEVTGNFLSKSVESSDFISQNHQCSTENEIFRTYISLPKYYIKFSCFSGSFMVAIMTRKISFSVEHWWFCEIKSEDSTDFDKKFTVTSARFSNLANFKQVYYVISCTLLFRLTIKVKIWTKNSKKVWVWRENI
jgi:hypothetical protein